MRNNITPNTTNVLLTDNFLLGHLIKDTINVPFIAFQKISNSYSILKEIESTNINNITFVLKISEYTENIAYIINKVFKDLSPLGYNLDVKTITDYKDFFDETFNTQFTFSKVI